MPGCAGNIVLLPFSISHYFRYDDNFFYDAESSIYRHTASLASKMSSTTCRGKLTFHCDDRFRSLKSVGSTQIFTEVLLIVRTKGINFQRCKMCCTGGAIYDGRLVLCRRVVAKNRS